MVFIIKKYLLNKLNQIILFSSLIILITGIIMGIVSNKLNIIFYLLGFIIFIIGIWITNNSNLLNNYSESYPQAKACGFTDSQYSSQVTGMRNSKTRTKVRGFKPRISHNNLISSK